MNKLLALSIWLSFLLQISCSHIDRRDEALRPKIAHGEAPMPFDDRKTEEVSENWVAILGAIEAYDTECNNRLNVDDIVSVAEVSEGIFLFVPSEMKELVRETGISIWTRPCDDKIEETGPLWILVSEDGHSYQVIEKITIADY